MADDPGVKENVGLIEQGNGDRTILKIPVSLLAVLVSIFISICGLWWNLVKNNAELKETTAVNQAVMQKDIQSLTRIVTRMDKRIDDDQATRYTTADALRDMALTNAKLADHEDRLRKLEAKRR